MPRHAHAVVVALFVAGAACVSAPDTAPSEREPAEPIGPTEREVVAELAERLGTSVEALSDDPCVKGCAGSVIAGCSAVRDACDDALVVEVSGVWMVCDAEAVLAACGAGPELYVCTVRCHARRGER